MQPTSFAFPLTCRPGHAARCSVVMPTEGGWNICVELDDRVVSTRHCTDWHRVERLCAQLEGQFCGDGDSPTPVSASQHSVGHANPIAPRLAPRS